MSEIFEKLEKLFQDNAPVGNHLSPAEALADLGTPTLSLAILSDNEIHSHCTSTGKDDTNTLFHAASVTKPVTGLATMRLIDLGHLSLEDHMVDRLPQDVIDILAKNTCAFGLMKQITVKHLLSHTSGLSVHGFDGYVNEETVPSIHQIIEGQSSTSPAITIKTPPGWQHMYSGGGFVMLQCVLEHVMQKAFPEIMQRYLFEPLNMTRSCYKLAPTETNVASAHHNGHLPCANKWYHKPELAAAGLWTTPTDLMKLVRAIQQSLAGQESFINKETAEIMLTKVADTMALSWQTSTFAFHHTGWTYPGWSCIMLGFADLPWNKCDWDNPGERTYPTQGVAIMTNSASGDKVYEKVLLALGYLQNWSHPFVQYPWSTKLQTPLPLARDEPLSEDWKGWVSEKWADKKRTWIVASLDGTPVAGPKKDNLLPLRLAAVPAKKYENGGKSIDFVVEGLEMMMRLGWEGEERVLEIHHLTDGQSYAVTKMRKGGPRLCDNCRRHM